jgi:regulation of enolase protein 1 (concanavalin A-like superfamily)
MRKSILVVFTVLAVSLLTLAYGISFAAASPAYIDEFAGPTLLPFWQTSGNLGSIFDLTANSGSLTITSPGSVDLGGATNDAPKLLQPVTGDFIAETKVTGDFTVSGSHAGLLIYIDDSHFMRLERRDGQKIQLGGKDGGEFIFGQYTLSSQVNPTCLKLEKTGTTIKGYWSSDGGITWNLLSWTEPFTGTGQVYIGLFVISQNAVSFPAVFDYFHPVPEVIFVLPEYPLGALCIPVAMIGAIIVFRVLKPKALDA